MDGVADDIDGALLALGSLGHELNMACRARALGRDMETRKEKAERYRKRAVEMHALAMTMFDPDVRKTLLTVAADYVHMAQTMEDLARSDGKPRL